MHIQLTLTAVADRDPSCNLFTYTVTHTVSLADGMFPEKIRTLAAEHKSNFRKAWPHNQTCPPLIPLDADVKVVE